MDLSYVVMVILTAVVGGGMFFYGGIKVIRRFSMVKVTADVLSEHACTYDTDSLQPSYAHEFLYVYNGQAYHSTESDRLGTKIHADSCQIFIDPKNPEKIMTPGQFHGYLFISVCGALLPVFFVLEAAGVF